MVCHQAAASFRLQAQAERNFGILSTEGDHIPENRSTLVTPDRSDKEIFDASRSCADMRRRTRWHWVRWYPINSASLGVARSFWHLQSSSETNFRFGAINAFRISFAVESALAFAAKASILASMAVNSTVFSSSYCFLAVGLRRRVSPRKRSFTILRTFPSK